MIDRFFRPLFGGITLDHALGVSSRFFYVALKSLAGGDSAVPAEGMDAISRQLEQVLPKDVVRLNSKVDAIDGTGVSCGSGRIEGRARGGGLRRARGRTTAGIGSVRLRPVSCVYFGAPSPPRDEPSTILDGDGSGPAAHAAVMTNVAPGYAPLDRALISVACPGTVARGLEAATCPQMRAWFGAEVDGWEELAVYRIPPRPPRPKSTFLAQAPRAAGRGALRGRRSSRYGLDPGNALLGTPPGTAVLRDLGVTGSSG